MESIEMKKRKREEYEMQLFGFHSGIVNATLKSTVFDDIQTRVSKLFNFLEQKYKSNSDDDDSLQQSKTKLAKAYYRGTKAHLPVIETCINKLLSIPQHVLLEEDKVQATQYTEQEFKNAEKNLENVQLQLKQAIMFNAALKNELEVAEDFKKNIDVAKTLSKIIEDGIMHPKITQDLSRLMKLFQNFNKQCKGVNQPSVNKNKEICRLHEPLPIDLNSL